MSTIDQDPTLLPHKKQSAIAIAKAIIAESETARRDFIVTGGDEIQIGNSGLWLHVREVASYLHSFNERPAADSYLEGVIAMYKLLTKIGDGTPELNKLTIDQSPFNVLNGASRGYPMTVFESYLGANRPNVVADESAVAHVIDNIGQSAVTIWPEAAPTGALEARLLFQEAAA